MSKALGSVNQNKQRGATLIVALIMLLLLTMIGVAGMQETQLQEKMAGGSQDREWAFQAAEAALRAGEADALLIATGACTSPCSTAASSGYVAYATTPTDNTGGLQRVETTYWQNYNWGAGGNYMSYPAAVTLDGVNTQPKYVVEELPSTYSPLANTSNGGTSGAASVRDFLITARGTGSTSDSVVILQSMYRYVSP